MPGMPSLSFHVFSNCFESEEKIFFLLFWLVISFKFDQVEFIGLGSQSQNEVRGVNGRCSSL